MFKIDKLIFIVRQHVNVCRAQYCYGISVRHTPVFI